MLQNQNYKKATYLHNLNKLRMRLGIKKMDILKGGVQLNMSMSGLNSKLILTHQLKNKDKCHLSK